MQGISRLLLRRIVGWKVLFWAGLGAGVGYGVSTLWPDVGAPANAERLTPEHFTVLLTPGEGLTESVARLAVYPPRDGVRLLTFDWTSDGKTRPAYAFANRPFLVARDLKNAVDEGRAIDVRELLGRIGANRPAAVAYTGMRASADRALNDVRARPKQRWNDVTEFLDHAHAMRPGFAYRTAWWADDRWRRDVPVAAGALLLGVLAAGLTRRSVADVEAADLLRAAKATPAATPVPSAAKDLGDVAAQGDAMEADLVAEAAEAGPGDTHTIESPVAPPVVRDLVGERLVAPEQAAKEDKDYAGEFYPTVRVHKPQVDPGGGRDDAFTLVELLVSVGVIGLLVALLLPALIGVRRSADTIACAANLRSIGQGLTLYLTQNRNTFPAAYLYQDQHLDAGWSSGTNPRDGYVHWSSYLYGNGSVNPAAFQCPAMRQGGLPPTNTPPDNRDPGQICPTDFVVDQQAPRLAYTVNEALCPRNKFNTADFGGHRVYRWVRATEVADASGTILALEMIDDAQAVSYDVTGSSWVMSHRPIAGFVGLNGELDMYVIPVGTKFRRATANDLDADPLHVADATHTRLDLVGRNHGKKAGYPDRRLTNFLYVDGHVETKSVYDTMDPFQWGAKFYSLTPNDDLVSE